MATKYKTNKRKISSLVKQQVPEFVLTDHPKFTEFLSSYYLFMESAELNLEEVTATDNIILETECIGDRMGGLGYPIHGESVIYVRIPGFE